MKQRRSRYQQMQWLMTYTLVGATGLFILYILFLLCLYNKTNLLKC